jgi:hypothetical protein
MLTEKCFGIRLRPIEVYLATAFRWLILLSVTAGFVASRQRCVWVGVKFNPTHTDFFFQRSKQDRVLAGQ